MDYKTKEKNEEKEKENLETENHQPNNIKKKKENQQPLKEMNTHKQDHLTATIQVAKTPSERDPELQKRREENKEAESITESDLETIEEPYKLYPGNDVQMENNLKNDES